jgi:hypothetical protein
MNRTLVGRITFLRGIRHQGETYIRQATELGNWTPFAAVALLWIFSRTYQQEKQRMHEERVPRRSTPKAPVGVARCCRVACVAPPDP